MAKRIFVFLIIFGVLALPAGASARTDVEYFAKASPEGVPHNTADVGAGTAETGSISSAGAGAGGRGFDWADAAIGAAVALGACGLAAGVLVWHRPRGAPRTG